jgi:hypothetical protein
MADPHIISALKKKRAELSADILLAEKRLADLRTDMESVDRTLLLFDPTQKPATIKPRLKRQGQPRFRTGEMTRSILTILREAAGPLTVREIALLIAKQHGLACDTPAAMRPLVANVRSALAWPRDGVVCVTRDDGVMVWGAGTGWVSGA